MSSFKKKLRLVRYSLGRMELKAAAMLVEHQMEVFARMCAGERAIVFTNMVMPCEVFYAAGLVPVHTELLAGWFSTLGLAPDYIRRAGKLGFHANICSYHKALVGALESGDIPPPRIAVFSSHICNGGSMIGAYLHRRFGTKVFILDVPHEPSGGEGIVRAQLDSLLDFLSDYTGAPVTASRLSGAADLSNQARYWLSEANLLRREVRFPGRLAIRNMYGATFLTGSQTGVEVARTYAAELAEKPAMPHNNRVLWIHFAPLFDAGVMEYLEQTLGCAIVFDITAQIYWDAMVPERPLDGITAKVLSHFYLGGTEHRMELVRRLVRQYRADGVVLFMQQGCIAIPGSNWEIREAARLEGKPFLELHGDCINPEGFSSEQIKLRMEAFSESLVNRECI